MTIFLQYGGNSERASSNLSVSPDYEKPWATMMQTFRCSQASIASQTLCLTILAWLSAFSDYAMEVSLLQLFVGTPRMVY